MQDTTTVIECPRDAWQGLPEIIPAEYKAEYLRALTLAGFRHIDAVSFVSPKHVKQMADSEEVMQKFVPHCQQIPKPLKSSASSSTKKASNARSPLRA